MRIARTEQLSGDELAAIRELMVLSFPDSFSEDDWQNSLGGVHVLVEGGGAPISHASVVPRTLHAGDTSLETGYVEAVATHPDRRRAGLGSQVMAAIGEHISASYELGALSTGEVGFYRRFGWEVWRGRSFVRVEGSVRATPEEDGGIMVLRTPRSPDIELLWPLSCEWRPSDVW